MNTDIESPERAFQSTVTGVVTCSGPVTPSCVGRARQGAITEYLSSSKHKIRSIENSERRKEVCQRSFLVMQQVRVWHVLSRCPTQSCETHSAHALHITRIHCIFTPTTFKRAAYVAFVLVNVCVLSSVVWEYLFIGKQRSELAGVMY